jgi:hypothetical protein
MFGLDVAGMGAEGFGARGDEVVPPLLNLRDGQTVGSGEFSGGGFCL